MSGRHQPTDGADSVRGLFSAMNETQRVMRRQELEHEFRDFEGGVDGSWIEGIDVPTAKLNRWLDTLTDLDLALVASDPLAPHDVVLEAMMLRARRGEHPHSVRGVDVPGGTPYGTVHDRDCPGCDGPYGTRPRDEAYWSS